MCGIHGFVGYEGRPAGWVHQRVRRMMAVAAHRGPDDQEVVSVAGAVFGFSRLSIVAPTRRDLVHRDPRRSRIAVFNGEIVNHAALRRSLDVPGDASDGAVILPLYGRFGAGFAQKLAGMFAIAIYDERAGVLELVRDPLGIKPLYYHLSAEGLIFSSEVKSIYAALDAAPEPEFPALDHFLTHRFHSGLTTVFPQIWRVPPGSRVTFSDGALRQATYWSSKNQVEACSPLDSDELAEFYRELIGEYCQADVRGGFFVSGGLDSSLVTAVAMQQQTAFRTPISIRFSPTTVEDEAYARLLETRLDTPFEWVDISDETARQALCELVPRLDEPLENPIHVGTFLMAKRARELGVKTVLTGDGSDEFFLGYDRHAVWFDGKGDAAQRYANMIWTLSPADAQALYRPDAYATRAPMTSYDGTALSSIDSTGLMLEYERIDRLVEYHCMRLDRMTMGCSVEARVPFLDHRLVEKVLAIPHSELFGGGGKAVLQKIAERWVPAEIIRRKKVHFPSLPDQWLRGAGLTWAKEILLDPGARIAAWINIAALERYLRQHGDGTRNRGRILWSLAVLELWCRGLRHWRDVKPEHQQEVQTAW